jgi:hypothetical protein
MDVCREADICRLENLVKTESYDSEWNIKENKKRVRDSFKGFPNRMGIHLIIDTVIELYHLKQDEHHVSSYEIRDIVTYLTANFKTTDEINRLCILSKWVSPFTSSVMTSQSNIFRIALMNKVLPESMEFVSGLIAEFETSTICKDQYYTQAGKTFKSFICIFSDMSLKKIQFIDVIVREYIRLCKLQKDDLKVTYVLYGRAFKSFSGLEIESHSLDNWFPVMKAFSIVSKLDPFDIELYIEPLVSQLKPEDNITELLRKLAEMVPYIQREYNVSVLVNKLKMTSTENFERLKEYILTLGYPPSVYDICRYLSVDESSWNGIAEMADPIKLANLTGIRVNVVTDDGIVVIDPKLQ